MKTKLTIKFDAKNIYPMSSFIIPALIRMVPELQFPYPIGYDTPQYLAIAIDYSQTIKPFPLLYYILGTLYRLGIDPIISMKIMPTILYGLLGASTYFLGRKLLEWDRWKSLTLVTIVSLSPAILRSSWDLNKQMLAFVLFTTSLPFTKKLESTHEILSLTILSVLVAISHELVFALMFFTLTTLILCQLYRKLRGSNGWKKTISLTLALTASTAAFLTSYRWNIEGVYNAAIGFKGETNTLLLNDILTLLRFYYLTTIPLAITGFFLEPTTLSLLISPIIGISSPFIPPYITISIPERWTIFLAYPLAIYATNSITRLKLNKPKPTKKLITLAIISIMAIPSYPLIGLCKWPTFIDRPTGYVPETMASSSAPAKDIEAIRKLAQKIPSDENTILITHDNYMGWTSYFNQKIRVIAWAEWHSKIQTPEEALAYTKTKNYKTIYLLWYDDNKAQELDFKKISQENTLSLYVQNTP